MTAGQLRADFKPSPFGWAFRVVGPCEDPTWADEHAKRYVDGAEPYCDISVSADGQWLASYGGSVWPSAWPSLFVAVKLSHHYGGGGMRITDAGLRLLARAAPPDHPLLQIAVERGLELAAEALGVDLPSKATP